MTKATGRFANGNSPTALFEKALSAFEIGGLTFAELQLTLKQQLADGASPADLAKIMERRELIEPLPDYAYEAVLGILQAEEAARGGSGAAAAADQSIAQSAVAHTTAADADSDEPAMSRLMQALAADWDPDSGKSATAPSVAHPLETEIRNLQTVLDQREEDLEAMRIEHARVLGLLEARARTAAQLEAGLRTHAAELKAVQHALQREQESNRALNEQLAEKIAAHEAARRRGAEITARSEEALRSAEHYKAGWTALKEEVAARDHALHEARRSTEQHEAALRQARHSLDERDSTLEQVRYSLSEHQAALDQTRQLLSQRDDVLDQTRCALIEREDELDQSRRLLSERDAQIGSMQQLQAEIKATLDSRTEAAAKLDAELQAALERGAALEADLITAHEALGAEQGKSRRLDILLAEKNGELAEKNAIIARAAALEGELDEAYRRIDELTSEITLRATQDVQTVAAPAPFAQPEVAEPARPAAAAKPTKHNVEVADFTPTPLKRKVDIDEIAASLPIGRVRRRAPWAFFGVCALVAAAILGIWTFTHQRPEDTVAAVPEAAPLPGTLIRDCETCPEFTVLPAGRFKQGSAEASASSVVKPLHWVAIEHPFAISTNDVTVAQFKVFADATARNMEGCDVYDGQWKHQQNSGWANPGFEQAASHPVTCTSWNDAKAYAQWLSAQTGHRYRLPSASEWEYAARAGSNAAQPWSGNGADACLNANVADASAARRYPGWAAFGCSDGFVYTSPVGSFKANAFGLHDTLGNVFQWTEDCWNANYIHAPIDGSARSDGNCAEHELRGGSWFSSPEYVRADYRNHFAADFRASSVGIRLARDIEP